MKLWVRLSLLTVTVLFLSTGISGLWVIRRTVLYNEEKTIDNYRQQLLSAAGGIGREIENSSYETYGEITRSAFYKYLIRKYGSSGYVLLKDHQVKCNMTDYELIDPSGLQWDESYTLQEEQELGDISLLILGERIAVNVGEDLRLILIRDISQLYTDMREQILLFAGVYAASVLCAVLVLFFMTRRLLRPLYRLQQTAAQISEGRLDCRAQVKGRDEIGEMAVSFNRMADRIEQQVHQLEQLAEQRKQLLGSLTHELKTPLTSIIGYSDTLLHVKLKPKQHQKALLHIQEESRRLERLSGKLMQLIGLYENESIAMEETQMEELFAKAAQTMSYRLDETHMTLDIICQMPPRKVDRDLFGSLLINLIDNAVKAGEEGQRILLEGDDRKIRITDQGRGIPACELERVTEAFYMVDKSRSRKAGGIGLGLALCSRIAALHHAELQIESKEGKGTTITVLFPE